MCKMRVITNQKGGGKTTTMGNVGIGLANIGEKVINEKEIVAERNGSSLLKQKKYGNNRELILRMVRLIRKEEKPREGKVTRRSDEINGYFLEDYSKGAIEGVMIQLWEEWQDRR